jgi:hypothetical protein
LEVDAKFVARLITALDAKKVPGSAAWSALRRSPRAMTVYVLPEQRPDVAARTGGRGDADPTGASEMVDEARRVISIAPPRRRGPVERRP